VVWSILTRLIYQHEIDDAIICALLEGPTSFNSLYLKTNKHRKVSRQSFVNHLRQLYDEKRITKNPKGKQGQIYSLNTDTHEFLKSFSNHINFDEDIAADMIKDAENFSKTCNAVYSKKADPSRMTKTLFSKPLKHVDTLLKGMKIISLLLASGDLLKSYEKKLENLHAQHSRTLKEIFKKTKEVNGALSILIRPGLYIEI